MNTQVIAVEPLPQTDLENKILRNMIDVLTGLCSYEIEDLQEVCNSARELFLWQWQLNPAGQAYGIDKSIAITEATPPFRLVEPRIMRFV